MGGLIGVDKEELMSPSVFWKIVRKNDKIVACMIYKFKLYGRKIVCGGTNDTPEGKIAFKNIMRVKIMNKEMKDFVLLKYLVLLNTYMKK